MTDDSGQKLPEAKVRRGYASLMSIWIVPAIALAVAGYLIFQALSDRGSEISIIFDNAEGMVPGKTQLKYKDVNIGTLSRIDILDNEEGVSMVIDVTREADKYLTDTARFWVVSPAIGFQGITGLQTLLSGSFIEIDPGKGGERKTKFTGLRTAPVITSTDKGTEYILSTEKLSNINRGTPIIYKGLQVGSVLGYRLADDRKAIDVYAFVQEPYDDLVLEGTNFWNAGGINVSVSTSGIELGANSLQSLVAGAIEFGTRHIYESTFKAESRHRFKLYDNEQAKDDARFTEKVVYVLYFDGSVSGLTVGGSVEFKGIKVGSVRDISLEIDEANQKYYIPVLIEIEPQRIKLTDDGKKIRSVVERRELRQKIIKDLIQRGLKAKLKNANFLTGQLIVDLDLVPDKPAVYVSTSDRYPEIPTVPADLEEITSSVAQLMAKLDKLPIERLGKSVIGTMEGLDKFINSGELQTTIAEYRKLAVSIRVVAENIDTKTLPNIGKTIDGVREAIQKIDATLVSAETMFTSVNGLIADGSPFKYDLMNMLQELAAASRAVRSLADFLERNPSSLISGKR
ncbi:MlaD family protein [uncultured Sneathiella sp.]|uniref:PqiB family protein n=1 Tax=uncultured Sneathiella sp. TaxID=879315 RepID=UPI002595AE9C|nr:MlaD family protein [uncultured Sneathiella sp.]